MRFLVLLTTTFMLFVFSTSIVGAQDENNILIYETTGQDTWRSISRKFNVCIDELFASNPEASYKDAGSSRYMNSIIKIPQNTPDCYFLYPAKSGENPLDIAEKFNICPEILGFFNYGFDYRHFGGIGSINSPLVYPHHIAIPLQEPPCYNTQGQRLHYHYQFLSDSWNLVGEYTDMEWVGVDENPLLDMSKKEDTRYLMQPGDFLVDIAQKYHLCMADLLAANPHFNDSATYFYAGQEINIPAVPLCKYPRQHILLKGDTLTYLSVIYNVCINRLIDANPALVNTRIKERTIIIIPDRPPCYKNFDFNLIKMHQYVCYSESVDVSIDYTGHEPVISPIAPDTPDNFCYEHGEHITRLIYQNKAITTYRRRPYDTMGLVAQCLDIRVDTLIALNNHDYPAEVRPHGYWILPEEYNFDCPLLKISDQGYRDYLNNRLNHAGYLDNDGIYVVNHQDTLSSIGKQFGYLPSSIAAENGLESPDVIFYLQELKMPSYPNYWQLAGIGGGILAVVGTGTLITGLLRWRRRKPKRKNENI